MQVSPVTVIWMPSQLGTTATYLPYTYSQAFSAVPDQLPSAVAGEIGYGTLKAAADATPSKRDAEAEAEPLPTAGIAGRIRR